MELFVQKIKNYTIEFLGGLYAKVLLRESGTKGITITRMI